MAKPINTIEGIVLLQPGVSLEGLEAGPTDKMVREFQRMLGGGLLCEEVDVLDLERAQQKKEEQEKFAIFDDLEFIENRPGLDPEALSRLWPVFSHGDGHTFYYCPPKNRFVAHYHDPDILEDIGGNLFEAINAALDANFNFVPEDFSPVYWKPFSSFTMRFGGFGRRITPHEFLAESDSIGQPSHVYCGYRRGDLIWAKQYSHLHYVLLDGWDSECGPTVDARFYSFQELAEVEEIKASLRLVANKLQLDIECPEL